MEDKQLAKIVESWLLATAKNLAKKNVLEVVGSIDEKMLFRIKTVLDIFEAKNSPGIKINFMSGEENMKTALAVYDLMKLYSGEKEGIVIHECSFSCLVIFQACDRRIMSRHSVIRFSRIASGYFDPLEMETDKTIQGKIVMEIISRRSRQSMEDIEEWCRNAREFTAEEALILNLTDGII